MGSSSRSIRAVAIVVAAISSLPGCAHRPAAPAGLGQPGEPVRLQVGYLPYFSGDWSAVVMRGRRLFERYLPAGSVVEFSSMLDGTRIAGALQTGQQQIGYLDDVAARQAVGGSGAAAVRLVAVAGLAPDQCSVLLVRADAPRLADPAAVAGWLADRPLAAPKDSCMARFAQRLQPADRPTAGGVIVNRNIEVITAGFRAGRIDAAVVAEPAASRLISEGVARRVADGSDFAQADGIFVAMRADLIARRPDIVEAWLRAELEAQRYLADPANAAAIVGLAAAQTTGFSEADLWQGLYGRHPEAGAGRLRLPFGFDEAARAVLAQDSAVAPVLRPDAIDGRVAARLLAAVDAAAGPPPAQVLALALPDGARGRPAPGALTIRVDPAGWPATDLPMIRQVLDAVAAELLSKFPGRPLAPIVVSRSMRTPVALYGRGPAGEYRIELTAAGPAPGPYVYEFAHEFCHVLANYERQHAGGPTRPHQWFEEALCEVASLYTLKALSAAWQVAAPSPQLAAAAAGLRDIALRFQQEAHRRLPSGTTLASWYAAQREQLGSSAYDRDRNEIVANLMLPLFEENPELWEAIGFLNLDAPARTFQQYLQNWLDDAPPRYRDVIRYTMSLFFERDALATGAARGQPRHPLEIIVTFGPGGGADGMARKLATLLEPLLGVPTLVSNVPGASGNAGLTRLLLSPDPDHTLVTLIALTAAAWADGVGTIGLADFTVLGIVQESPSMLFVASNSPLRSFDDFLAAARASPGRLRVATSGRGTLDDLTLALLAEAGYRTTNAPFANPEDRYDAALARRTDALFEEPGDVAGELRTGRLRPLVVFAEQRHPEFPDIPAAREFGLALADLPNFRSLAIGAGVAPDKVAVLVAALNRALDSDEWRAYCTATYSCAPRHTPAQARARVQALFDHVSAYRERLPH